MKLLKTDTGSDQNWSCLLLYSSSTI